MINNNIELWSALIGTHSLTESEAQAAITKAVYKATECGCSFTADTSGVNLSGYAEGSNATLNPKVLFWGFTIEEWNQTMAEADAEGVEEWHSANPEE